MESIIFVVKYKYMKEQILLGTLLGDAYMSKLSGKKEMSSIGWEHSLKQEEYALWKAKNSLNNYSFYKRDRLDSRTNNTYHSIICYSTKDNYKDYRKLFYNDKKEVSQEILNKLEPLGVAVWYMDDGNIYYNSNNCHISIGVNNFSNQSKQLIINWFKEKYNLNFKISSNAIRITSRKECEIFMNIVEKYIHESMNYKKLSSALLKYKNSLTEEQLNRRWKKNR